MFLHKFLIISSKISVIRAIGTALWKMLELIYYSVGILILTTNYFDMGAKQDTDLVISEFLFCLNVTLAQNL